MSAVVNCVILDEEELLLAKGAIVRRSDRDAVVDLSPGEYSRYDFVRDREINIRLFDNINGLTTCRGRVFRIEEDRLYIYDCLSETHIERREDVKVPVNREIFVISRERNSRNIETAHKFSAFLRDISAGGVGIETDYELLFDKEYEMVFDLGRDPDILSIMLVRKMEVDSGKSRYGCRFVDLHPSQESQVREYVFKKHLGLLSRL